MKGNTYNPLTMSRFQQPVNLLNIDTSLTCILTTFLVINTFQKNSGQCHFLPLLYISQFKKMCPTVSKTPPVNPQYLSSQHLVCTSQQIIIIIWKRRLATLKFEGKSFVLFSPSVYSSFTVWVVVPTAPPPQFYNNGKGKTLVKSSVQPVPMRPLALPSAWTLADKAGVMGSESAFP